MKRPKKLQIAIILLLQAAIVAAFVYVTVSPVPEQSNLSFFPTITSMAVKTLPTNSWLAPGVQGPAAGISPTNNFTTSSANFVARHSTASQAARTWASRNPTSAPRLVPGAAFVSEVGPHSRTFTIPAAMTTPSTNGFATTNGAPGRRVTMMGTGMNFWDGQQWSQSDPSWAATSDGFAATRVQHATHLNANLNTASAVTVTMGGQTVSSTPVAIGLYDAASGNSAIIGNLVDTYGVVVSSNRILYQNCFQGVSGSIVYTMERGAFHQDVVLTANINPADWGFPVKTTRIQVISEFYGLATNQPDIITRPIRVEKSQVTRARMTTPDFVDQAIGIGAYVLQTGRAYTGLPGSTPTNPAAVVAKQLVTTSDQRTFLVENVEYSGRIQKALNLLPPQPSPPPRRTALFRNARPSKLLYAGIPVPALRQSAHRPAELASANAVLPCGLTVDYVAYIGGTLYDTVTFTKDSTYFLTDYVYCNGPAVLEAAVFKFFPSNTSYPGASGYGGLVFLNGVDCKTANYDPAFFTAAADTGIGDGLIVDQSQLIPGYYPGPAVWASWSGGVSLHDLRIYYASQAIEIDGLQDSVNSIANSQFVNCVLGVTLTGYGRGSDGGSSPVSPYTTTLNNCLMAGVGLSLLVNCDAYGGFNNCTLDQCQMVAYPNTTQWGFGFTNSILSNIGAFAAGGWSFDGVNNGFFNCGSGSDTFGSNPFPTTSSPFVTFPADTPFFTFPPDTRFHYGAYYLADSSGFQGQGTAANTDLLPALQGKTTHPPLDFPLNMYLSGEMMLSQMVPRYTTGPPDLGYYYSSLDVTVAGFLCDGARINVLPGTAIGIGNDWSFQDAYPSEGFIVFPGSSFISEGTPNNPITFVSEKFVQEGPFWYDAPVTGVPTFVNWTDESSSLSLRFCNLYLPPESSHFFGGGNYGQGCLINWSLRDCALYGGMIQLLGSQHDYDAGAVGNFSWFNNVFDRVSFWLDPGGVEFHGQPPFDFQFQAYNNTFRGSYSSGGRAYHPTDPVRFLGSSYFNLDPYVNSDGSTWVFRDNLFDKVAFSELVYQDQVWQNVALPLDHDYNAYWMRTSDELAAGQVPSIPTNTGSAAHDVFLQSPVPYYSGPLGDFYVGTNWYPVYWPPLYGAGDRPVADAGLFHYTTRPDQVKEGEEPSGHNVNIGLHYVATYNPSSVHLRDADTDGIPDYVENWHGDGNYQAHADTETDWQNAYTSPGVYDPTNSLYDNIDLSGDGLVGRINAALGLHPFTSTDPLTLIQVAGNNGNTVAFEVPVKYSALTNAGVLGVSIDGHNVAMGGTSQAPDGNTLFTWNSTYDPPGQHYLQARFTLSVAADDTDLMELDDSDDADVFAADAPEVLSAAGPIVPFYSANTVQFFKAYSLFDSSGASLAAQLVEQNASYSIALYDPSTAPPTLLSTITGSTSDGIIQQDWDLTKADGSLFAGNMFQAVYNVTPGAPSTDTLTRVGLQETVSDHDGFDFAYFYEPRKPGFEWSFGDPNGIEGPLWEGMKGAVDTLLAPAMVDLGSPDYYVSGFNYYDFQGGNPHGNGSTLGYPGYLASWGDITNLLLPDFTSASTHVKNVYMCGHGNLGIMGSSGAYSPPLWITSGTVAQLLGNFGYFPGWLNISNPYRFVFLDGCRTAMADYWPNAFGIVPLATGIPNANLHLGPQAFVGWGGDSTAWFGGIYYLPFHNYSRNKSVELAWSYSQTLLDFYDAWISGETLSACISMASHADQWGQVPLSVPPKRSFRIHSISGPSGYQVFDFKCKVGYAAPIYVIGHSGLTRHASEPQSDGQYSRPW